MSPLTFLEIEGAVLLVGLLVELTIATLVLKGVRRARPAGQRVRRLWHVSRDGRLHDGHRDDCSRCAPVDGRGL